MKICWDNLEKLRYSKKTKKWYKSNHTYYLKICTCCNNEYLGLKNSNYCCKRCSVLNENHPMYGKKLTEEIKKKISKKLKGKFSGNKNPSKRLDVREKISKKLSNKYTGKNIPLYDTYAHQIKWCETVRRNEKDPNILEVKCAYCGKWFIPKIWMVRNRIQSFKNKINYKGEFRFYCSKGCKKSCPIYHKKPETIIKEDRIRAGRLNWIELNRETQPELRQMVFERDGYKCNKCGSKETLHCHHIEGIRWEPLESADIDRCITLCKNCHKKVHKKDGCKYNDLRCGEI